MKKLFLILSIVISISASGQSDSTITKSSIDLANSFNLVGYKMDQFRTQALIGSTLEILGGTVIMYNYSKDNEPSNGLLITGTVITAAGILVHLMAYDRLHDAAKELKRIKPASTGIGISYSF